MKHSLLFLCALISLLTSVCYSQDYNTYVSAAINGDAEAQYNLGSCFFSGKGIRKNEQRAIFWWRESAEQDYAPAQYILSLCYFEGIGVKYNEDSAFYYLGSAMANEYPPALYYGGELLYDAGDKNQGIIYIAQAAALGNDDAKKFMNDKTEYVLTDKDVKSIKLADLKSLADEFSTYCPLDIDYMTTLVKVTFKDKEFVYSYIIDEDFVEMTDIKEAKNILKQNALDDMINRSKVMPNVKQMYKAIVQKNVTLVLLYKGSVSKEVIAIKVTPLEIKRTLKL